MGKAAPKIILNPSRDIPFSCLVLSQSNVRRVKAGVSIAELAEDIAHRSLLQSLAVRPVLDTAGAETGQFEVPAGGRRYRALELLVKQKRLAKDAPVPCVVKLGDDVLAVEDSYAENSWREPLHPLDQFRGMQDMVEKGQDVEAIAARFQVTPAVVRQRLKLAGVSSRLHEVYAEDGMTLDQLMAFSVSDDHERQEQVWELLAHSYNKSPGFIRQKLTEDKVRVSDKRVRFVGLESYVAAGGDVMRDLFEPDDGGWLTDPALLDRLVAERLQSAAHLIGLEGWKWVVAMVDLPWNAAQGLRELSGREVELTEAEAARLILLQEEADLFEREWADVDDLPEEIYTRIDVLDREIGMLCDRPVTHDPQDIAMAGVFLSINVDGSLLVERGFVKPEDELAEDNGDPDLATVLVDGDGTGHGGGGEDDDGLSGPVSRAVAAVDGEEDAQSSEDVLKPLSPRLISELTAWRTLALQDALAQNPGTAFAAVIHSLVLQTFFHSAGDSCLTLAANKVSFGYQDGALNDSPPARAIAARHADWKTRLPRSEKDLWEALLRLDDADQALLFAHCASLSLTAHAEIIPKYDNGRVSRSSVERHLAHSHVIARMVGLDLVAAGWRPTVSGYFQSVTKPRILADVTEAKGERFASMIDHLKKGDMAREAERLLEAAGWLPEPMRTPEADGEAPIGHSVVVGDFPEDEAELPAFLDGDPASQADNDDAEHHAAA